MRRAAYWSLLVSPTAGVTYGHNSIWVWAEEPQVPEGHEPLGTVAPWHEGLEPPGAESMAVLRSFFEKLPWWRLRPAQELLAEQPGERDPRHFVAAASTEEGSLAVLYLPEGGEVSLNLGSLKLPATARWFDPGTGEWLEAGTLSEERQTLRAPGDGDRVLCIGELE